MTKLSGPQSASNKNQKIKNQSLLINNNLDNTYKEFIDFLKKAADNNGFFVLGL